jgi:hypothetical protein
MTKQNIIQFGKKNWKTLVFILLLGGLVLFNVKQYQQASKIIAENQRVNIEYKESLKREAIYNQQIAQYKSEIDKKDSIINAGKQEIAQTEAELQVSQKEVKRLSKKILNGNTTNPDSLKAYVNTCDSLATIAPILSNQVDTLKAQNKVLVTTMEDKSKLQDSIIAKKDIIIGEKDTLLKTALDSYNKATDKIATFESKLNKEKKRKSFWKKTSLVLTAIVVGVFATK